MTYQVGGAEMANRRRDKKPRGVVLTSFAKQGSMDAYLHEWHSIRESRLLVQSDEESSDEGDPDAIWLENAGFGNYVDKLQSGDGVDDTGEAFLHTSVLPKAHAAVVRKRMNTFRSTLRSKQQNGKDRSDVRDVFHSKKANSTAPVSGRGQTPSPKASPAISPRGSPTPSHPHTPTTVTLHSKPPPVRLNRVGETTLSPSHPHHSALVSPSHRTQATSRTPGSGGQTSGSSGQTSGSRGQTSGSSGQTSESIVSQSVDQSGGVPRSVSSGQASYSRVTTEHSLSVSGRGGFTHSVDTSSSTTTQTRTLLPPAGLPGLSDATRLLGDTSGMPSPPLLTRSSEVLLRPARDLPDRRVTPPPGDRKSGSSSSGSRHSNRSSSSPGVEDDIKLHFGSPAHLMTSNGSPELPNFMIMPDALGITQLADLSSADLEKVRSVALLELTVTFEDHNIPLRPRRPHRTKNLSENALFGVPLSVLLQNDRRREPNAQIPLIIEEILSYLEQHGLSEEGILRVPGSQARVAALTQELEASFRLSGTGGCFTGKKVSDISTLLKQFLRALPSPLLTKEYLPAFASIADLEDLKEQVRTLNLLVLLLPDLHQSVLKRFLEFLEKVTQHCEQSKMDLMNVSMVMAPNLFVSLPTRHNLDDVSMAAKTSHVVRLLIKYHNLLWTVPGEMLRQVRYLNEAEVKRLSQRSVQKALKQMQQQPSRRLLEADHYIVRVKAPLFTRVCMAVDITDGVTAGDIVKKMQKKSKLNKDAVRKQFPTGPYIVAPPDPPTSWGNPLPPDHNPRTRHSVPDILESTGPAPLRPSTLLPFPSSHHHSRGSLPTPSTDFPAAGGSPIDETASINSLSPCNTCEELDLDAVGEQFLYEVGGNIGQRRLNHDTDMHVLYSINSNATWVIKPRDCPDLV